MKLGVPFYHEEFLSEQTEHHLDTIPYEYLIAATDSNSYNALVCTTFMPEYGRTNVFKVSPYDKVSKSTEIVSKVGGRILFKQEVNLEDLIEKVESGFVFRQTMITEQYSYKQYLDEKDEETVFLYIIKPSGKINYYSEEMRTVPSAGDIIVSLMPPTKEKAKIQARLTNES